MPLSNFKTCNKCQYFYISARLIPENPFPLNPNEILTEFELAEQTSRGKIEQGYVCSLNPIDLPMFQRKKDFQPFEIPTECPFLLESILKNQC